MQNILLSLQNKTFHSMFFIVLVLLIKAMASLDSNGDIAAPKLNKFVLSRVIEGDLKITPIQITNREDLYYLVEKNRKYLSQWLEWVPFCKKKQDVEKFIVKSIADFDKSKGVTWCIKKGNALIGVVSLIRIDWNNMTAEIGYWIDQSSQGQGYVTKSCREIINISFNTLVLKKLKIYTTRQNIKSQNVAKRLNFIKSKDKNLEKDIKNYHFELLK